MEKKTKKQQIYKEAAKLFHKKGYKAASMRELAEQVQLKASSLYSHIGSKEEILIKICFDNAEHFLKSISIIEKMEATIAEKIKSLLLLHIQTALQDTTSATVFNDEWRHLSEPYLSQFISLRKDYENRFRQIIQIGVANGELKALQTEILLYSLLNVAQWLHNWYKPTGKVKVDELEKDIVAIMMQGICQR